MLKRNPQLREQNIKNVNFHDKEFYEHLDDDAHENN